MDSSATGFQTCAVAASFSLHTWEPASVHWGTAGGNEMGILYMATSSHSTNQCNILKLGNKWNGNENNKQVAQNKNTAALLAILLICKGTKQFEESWQQSLDEQTGKKKPE